MRVMRVFILAAGLLLLSDASAHALAEEDSWPRRVDIREGTLILYEPEYESFSETQLTGRAALGWDRGGEAGLVFGALWFTATTRTDRDGRRVEVLSARVTDWRFPDESLTDMPSVGPILEAEIPRWEWVLPLDDLTHKLALAEKERQMSANLSSVPPKIRFSTTPETLILFDGQPEWRPLEGSKLLRAINTPALMVMDPSTGRHYLSSGEDWMKAQRFEGPWEADPNPPAELLELPRRAEAAEGPLPPREQTLPRIVVVTEPTELIVSDGEPRYKLFPGNELLYMSNTDSDVLLDIPSQRHYVLLSGRWFSSWTLDGPWTHVEADRLPASFLKIPADSEKSYLLNHVAGTPQAARAVKDAEIPRITAVNRHEASLNVVYDGYPRFAPIEGTDMRYALNSAVPVIEADGHYYAVDDGVWFEANDPEGPWRVADTIPDKILTLPPDSPVYHTRFVRIYDATPDVVYVGYTPGYLGGYVYNGTVVYGTGYYYRPWIGAYYYPWPYTWGFHASYDPWYGWGFGWGFLFWYGWWPHHHHHYYNHHHHIYTPPHHRPPPPKHKKRVIYDSKRWWGPGGYRSFDRKRDRFEPRSEFGKDDRRFFDKSRAKVGRVFPPAPEGFAAPGRPEKKIFKDGPQRRDKVDAGGTARQKPRDRGGEVIEPRKNFFTDRYNRKDRIEPEREFPRSSRDSVERQKEGGFTSPGKTPPTGGYRHTPRFSPHGGIGGERERPSPPKPGGPSLKRDKPRAPAPSFKGPSKERRSAPPRSFKGPGTSPRSAPKGRFKPFGGPSGKRQTPSVGRGSSSAPSIRAPQKRFDFGGSSTRGLGSSRGRGKR